jgi:hypothetical protein
MDDTIEEFAREFLPPGGRRVSVRIDDGPPRRGVLYRTDAPFAPLVHELRTPEGKLFTIDVRCVDGYALVTWGEAGGDG